MLSKKFRDFSFYSLILNYFTGSVVCHPLRLICHFLFHPGQDQLSFYHSYIAPHASVIPENSHSAFLWAFIGTSGSSDAENEKNPCFTQQFSSVFGNQWSCSASRIVKLYAQCQTILLPWPKQIARKTAEISRFPGFAEQLFCANLYLFEIK